MDLLHGIRSLAVDYFFVSQCTHLTERGQIDFDRKTVRMFSQSHGKNVKMSFNIHYHLPLASLTATCRLHCFVMVSIILLIRKSAPQTS